MNILNFGAEMNRSVGDKKAHHESSVRNFADSLPHDCHTETMAKLARLGPAKNGTID